MLYLLNHAETARLHFRPIAQEDCDAWLPFFKDPSSFKHWVAPEQDPEDACREWFVRQKQRYNNNEGGMNALIEKASGKLIGYCGLLVQVVDHLTELEIGYSLLPDFRGKGFATEAARQCRDFAFENRFSESLISIISLTNTASMNVAIKNGMKAEKETVYKGNEVTIFRIEKKNWAMR
jgi:RimJ/RimL family protein N-acetyltransferase